MDSLQQTAFAHHGTGTRITATHMGRLRCSAEHQPTGARIETDGPALFGGHADRFSPLELVSTGLACCIETMIGVALTKAVGPKAAEHADIRVAVTSEMAPAPEHRLARIPLTAWVGGDLTESQKSAVVAAAKACPVGKSLNPSIKVPALFIWADGATTSVQIH